MPSGGGSSQDLAERIRRLEDIEAIRKVMGDYVLAADDRHGFRVNVERTIPLFAKHGIWDGGVHFGRHEGRDAIEEYLLRGRAGIDWSLHHLSNPSIEISPDGQSAHGRWYLVEMARMLNAATNVTEMVCLSGTYDGSFIHEDGAWKFEVLKFDCQSIVGPTPIWGVFLPPAPRN